VRVNISSFMHWTMYSSLKRATDYILLLWLVILILCC